MSRSVGVGFLAIAELALALGVRDLSQRKECWTHQVDARWWIAVNGKQEPQPVTVTAQGGPEGAIIEVPGYSALVYFNGWPAGILDPFGGILAGSGVANEATLIAALQNATPRPDQSLPGGR